MTNNIEQGEKYFIDFCRYKMTMADPEITLYRLAKMTGINQTSLANYFSLPVRQKISYFNVLRICTALKINIKFK